MYIPKRHAASSRLTPVSTCGTGSGGQEHSYLSYCLFFSSTSCFVPTHRLSYVLPGRSGSSSPVPAYSGSSPESRVSGLFQNHKLLFVD
ncbi:hypothetical protein T08_11450 [Trichinella sp. T8]|nr:hypothetical protein T08_11450 [Trichinella sp. T8]